MADNIALSSGEIVAAKDAANVKHQRMLLELVVAGVPTDLGPAARLPVADDAVAAALAAALDVSDRAARLLGHVAVDQDGDVASTLTDGRQVVAVPGTAVAIRATLPCKWVTVTALTSNTAQVNVGGATVLAAAGSSRGVPLAAGQSATIPVNNAAKVFVDARVAGQGVDILVGS